MAFSSWPNRGPHLCDRFAIKVVFVDGVAFYQFACHNGILDDSVEPPYDILFDKVNTVTCDELNLNCFFPYPATGSICYDAKSGTGSGEKRLNVAVPGILGTIGWNHETDASKGVEQNVFDEITWNAFWPGAQVVLKGDEEPVTPPSGSATFSTFSRNRFVGVPSRPWRFLRHP